MSEEDKLIYVRVKRRQQTFCLQCRRGDTVAALKAELLAALAQHPLSATEGGTGDTLGSDDLRLLAGRTGDGAGGHRALQDDAPLADTAAAGTAEDEAVLFLVLRLGDGEWEPVEVVPTEA